MKNLLLIFVLILFGNLAFGQFIDYDLSKQQLGDYQFEGLDFSLSLRGSGSQGKQIFENSTTKYGHSKFVPNVDIGYTKIVNNRKAQTNHNAQLKVDGEYSKRNFFTDKVTNNTSSIEIQNDYVKRFYKDNKIFFGIGNELDISYQKESIDTLNIFKDDFNSHNFKIGVPLSIGYGRIENVTDAWRAYRTFEDLHKFGVLEKMPSDEDINSLAALNTLRQNWRFFDSRLKRIEDVKLLASHFLEGGFIKEENHFFYNSIFDMWAFGTNGLRRSGKRFELTVTPTYQNRKYFNYQNRERKSEYTLLSISPTYAFHKPINLKWQWDVLAGFENTLIALEGKKMEHESTNVFINNRIGYYPTSRTAISGMLYLYTRTPSWEPLLNSTPIFESFLLRSDISVSYYLSPQTRINAYVYYSNSNSFELQLDKVSRSNTQNNISFNLGFNHAFF